MVNIRKTRLVWTLAVLFGLASLLLAVGRSHAETLGFSVSDDIGGELNAPRVVVLDDQSLKPLEGATVEASAVGGTPSITVTRAGYASTTVVGAQSKGMIVYLKKLPEGARNVVASGKMQKWMGAENRDWEPQGSTVYAGLALKSLNAFDLLDFDVDSVISPLKDSIYLGTLVGKREVPSNLMFPEQDVFLSFISVTLDKPNYRLPVRRGEPTRLVSLQGNFNSDDILPSFQGGKMSLTLLNKIKFTHAGLTGSVTPTQDYAQLVDANQALAAGKHKVTVSKPPFAADVLTIATTDAAMDRQFMMPTDIKLAVEKEKPTQVKPVTLASPATASPDSLGVLTIAMSDKGRMLSGILTAKAGANVSPGEFMGTAQVEMEPRTLPETVPVRAPSTGVGTAIFNAELFGPNEKSVPVWYVYTLPSAGEVSVPTQVIPGADSRYPVRSYAVVQLDLGSGFDEKKVDGTSALRKLQRFSRVSAKIAE